MKKHSTTIFWIIPLLFFIHNLEEAFQMPQYLANQFSIRLITSQQFFIAISVLTIFVLLIVFYINLTSCLLYAGLFLYKGPSSSTLFNILFCFSFIALITPA
ncbi:HXXEE domain-containing protein [Bacillus cereus]|nr:HXXEE domain-containing protein [Bacillus sp. B2-WWTP-C-10-Post-4]MCU4996399.1 HXXEE domain-containing protein [Bacillus cereus]